MAKQYISIDAKNEIESSQLQKMRPTMQKMAEQLDHDIILVTPSNIADIGLSDVKVIPPLEMQTTQLTIYNIIKMEFSPLNREFKQFKHQLELESINSLSSMSLSDDFYMIITDRNCLNVEELDNSTAIQEKSPQHLFFCDTKHGKYEILAEGWEINNDLLQFSVGENIVFTTTLISVYFFGTEKFITKLHG